MIIHLLLAYALAAGTPHVAPPAPSEEIRAPVTPELVPSLPGIANARRRVTLTAPLEGVLLELRCAEGNSVERGAILAVLDNRVPLAAAKLAAAEATQMAAIVRAESDLETARKLVARMTQAGANHAASELEVERAHAAADQAEATLQQAREQQAAAQAGLDLERAKLEAYNIRAPFAGRVTRIHGEQGETLTLVKPLLELTDASRLRVDLYVPIACYSRLEEGASYQLWASEPLLRAVSGRLVLKDKDIDPGTQTFRCVFEIDNAAGELPSGFMARLIVPREATTNHGFSN
jgi:RND family efflux transporter MFP subunit